MGPPQQARWKEASDKEIVGLEKHGVFEVVQRYGMKGCNTAYTPGVGPELSLNQPEERLLDKVEKRRYQVITGAVVYLVQVTHYDILYAVIQLAGAMSKPVKAYRRWTSICFATWPGSQTYPSPTSRAASSLLPSRMPTVVRTSTMAGLRHHTS